MVKTILLTGTLGFIYSNFVRKIVRERSDYRFVGVDKAARSWCLKNIWKEAPSNYTFYFADIADAPAMNNIFSIERPDIVINAAAESFVDHAIESAIPFVHSNIMGMQVMIDLSVKYGIEKFIQISTDEVYGQLKFGDDPWTEQSPTKPRNPYSASKLCSETLLHAANQTHSLQYNITRCCNNFGPMQPIRNLIPVVINSIQNNQPIPIHGTGKNMREWIYATDHCDAVMKIIEKNKPNEIYNVGSNFECSNLDMIRYIGQEMGKKPIISFIQDRKAHDQRYFLNCAKIEGLGWKPEHTFEQGLHKCVQWYIDNPRYYE